MPPCDDAVIPLLLGALAMLILCVMARDAIGKMDIAKKRSERDKREYLRSLENKGPDDE